MGKVKRNFLTIKDKTEILRKLHEGVSVNSLVIKYGVNKSTISRIKKSEMKLRKFIETTESCPRKRKTLKQPEYPKMEAALYKWFQLQRSRHIPISTQILTEKAKTFHQKYEKSGSKFNCSVGWIDKFKKRHGIRFLKICGEKLSSDTKAVDPFIEKLQKIIEEKGLSLHQIYNADESGLFWKMLPTKTLVAGSERSAPGRKVKKDRITFLVCSNAAGSHKLKLFLIGKSENPRAFKNFNDKPVVYRSSKNAWMTYSLFENWFFQSFVPEVREHLRSQNLPERALLLIDNAPSHFKEGGLKTEDELIEVMFLPPNCTAVLQPMDQSPINQIKVIYKKSLMAHIIANEDTNLEKTMKDLTLKDAVLFLADAWNKISSTTLQKCWKPLLSPSEDDWDPEDLISLSVLRENLRSSQEEIQDLISRAIPGEGLNYEETMEWIHERFSQAESLSNNSDEDTDMAINNHQQVKTDEVISALNICLEWAKINNIDIHHIISLQQIRELAVTTKLKNLKQTKIHSFFKTS